MAGTAGGGGGRARAGLGDAIRARLVRLPRIAGPGNVAGRPRGRAGAGTPRLRASGGVASSRGPSGGSVTGVVPADRGGTLGRQRCQPNHSMASTVNRRTFEVRRSLTFIFIVAGRRV